MGRPGVLEQIGENAQKEAIKLKVGGLSLSAIADELNKKHGSSLTTADVKNFLKRKGNQTFQILKEDKNFKNKLHKTYFDTLNQLVELNEQMWEFFYEIKKNPELKDKIITCKHCKKRIIVQMQSYGLLLKTADHILKQIDHVDKVLGKMQNRALNITYNIVDLSKKLTQVIPQLFNDAERKGLIKIKNRKRLRAKII